MNDLVKQLMSALDGNAISALSQQINATPQQTQGAVNAALPVLLGMLSNNCQSKAECESLAKAVERDHSGGGILDQVQGFFKQGDTSQGQGILGHILGARQAPAAQQLATQTGLQGAQITKLLALLAPVVLGALGRQSQAQGGLNPNMLGGLLQGALGSLGQNADGASLGAQVLGQLLGGAGGSSGGNPQGNALGSLLGGLLKR